MQAAGAAAAIPGCHSAVEAGSRRVRLRDRGAGEPLPISSWQLVPAEMSCPCRARKVRAPFENGARLQVGAGFARRALRLPCDKGGERQQFATLEGSGSPAVVVRQRIDTLAPDPRDGVALRSSVADSHALQAGRDRRGNRRRPCWRHRLALPALRVEHQSMPGMAVSSS